MKTLQQFLSEAPVRVKDAQVVDAAKTEGKGRKKFLSKTGYKEPAEPKDKE